MLLAFRDRRTLEEFAEVDRSSCYWLTWPMKRHENEPRLVSCRVGDDRRTPVSK